MADSRRQRAAAASVLMLAALLAAAPHNTWAQQDAAPPSPTAPEQPNYYAVIIGVSEFENLPKEEWLDFADDDAKAFYDFITSPRGRNFPPENVFMMTNQDALSQAMRSRMSSAALGDVQAITMETTSAQQRIAPARAAQDGHRASCDARGRPCPAIGVSVN